MQIAIAIITLLCCGGFLFWFKRGEKKTNLDAAIDERERAALATAQEFVNAKDISERNLYTLDGNIFAFIKVEGLCLELYSRQELKLLCKQLTVALARIRYPYKQIAVSRPVNISAILQEIMEMYSQADGGRRQLLLMEHTELTDMIMSGATLERQHYIAIWNSNKREDERQLIARAEELAKIYKDNGIPAEVIYTQDIVRLCNLVNNPAYVHIECADIQDRLPVIEY